MSSFWLESSLARACPILFLYLVRYVWSVSKSVSINDSAYPALLKQIDDPPRKLFYKGNISDRIFGNCLGVVGSRRATQYGRKVTEDLVFKIAGRGITIVSGFMYGVDMIAHETAMASGGKTVAVVAYGIDRACPRYLQGNYDKILESEGAVLSEYGEDEPARKFMFPKRNRVIAGLCKAVLVVEAGLGSGSLITAGYALEYGRTLFMVPGSIYNHNSKGTNDFLKLGKAVMVTKVEDVLKIFKVEARSNGKDVAGVDFSHLNKEQQFIMKCLYRESLSRDELCKITSIPVSVLNRELTMLSLMDLIMESGGRYCVNRS